MRPDESVQVTRIKGVLLAALAAVLAGPPEASAQALSVQRLPGGTDLVVVSLPLSDATTVAWPELGADDEIETRTLVAGRLTLTADLEAALSGRFTESVPPVIVAVGGASPTELAAVVPRMLGDGRPAAVTSDAAERLVEGGLDRHLGSPGSEAGLRLVVPLPPAQDWRRSSAEVLWELAPALMPPSVPAMTSRVEGDRALLEGRVNAELAEIHLREIRLALARFAADPVFSEAEVAEARDRLEVRRQASLEEHPQAAERVLDRWRAGGEAAVRETLFGLRSVTLASIATTAADWLPAHPGQARLTLPPGVFNPRFATGPRPLRLANDLSAAVLERTAATMAVVCLRPVLVPDFDGDVTATVLARVARELRGSERRPGWIRVRQHPPLLEIAGPADAFGELLEQLAQARRVVAGDRNPVAAIGDGSSRRALDLMAGLVMAIPVDAPSAASLLRPGNLAIGVVVPDGEAAAEALAKFWGGGDAAADTTLVENVPPVRRTRAAAPGPESTVVVALDLGFGGGEALVRVAGELVETRLRALLPDARSRVLRPYVPGRFLLIVEVSAEGALDRVETMVRAVWPEVAADIHDDELAPVRRRAAARTSAALSGVSGHARHAAATAAGAALWRRPAELELEILALPADRVAEVLAGFASFDELEITGAGELPISEIDDR
jgi:hypothetical protein